MRQQKCRLCGHEHPLGAPHATGTAGPERQERSRDHRPGKKAAVKTVTIGAPRIGKTAAVDRQVAKAVKAGARVFRTKLPAKNTEAAVREVAVQVPSRWASEDEVATRRAKSAALDKKVDRAIAAGRMAFIGDPPPGTPRPGNPPPLPLDRPKPATLNDVVREIATMVRDDGQPEPERLPFTDSDVNALDPVECFLASPAGRTIPPEVRKVITDHLAERAERRKYMREYQRGRRKAKKRKAKR